MRVVAEVLLKLISLIILPVLIVGYAIVGAFRGLHVYCWNFVNSPCVGGEWKFIVPKAAAKS